MKRLFLPTLLVLTALLAAAVANGEMEQSGNLRLTFSGGFKPHALPRSHAAPVNVSLEGSIRTIDGTRPPQLRRISVAVNRYAILSTRGLPMCDSGELEATTTEEALSRCGGARVGSGRFGANVDFPSRPPIPVEGKMLAFNARLDGRPGILMHIYGSNPVQATFVLPFRITHQRQGAFGTAFTTVIPKIASDLGYVTDLNLTFGRTYRFAGKARSFLSARCAAPAGFPGALFVLARGSFTFATGRQLTTTLTRDCSVR
jgi:hypothetical protein